jgi:hypothetical protein
MAIITLHYLQYFPTHKVLLHLMVQRCIKMTFTAIVNPVFVVLTTVTVTRLNLVGCAVAGVSMERAMIMS